EWMNGHYINHVLSVEDLAGRCRPYLEGAGLVDGSTDQGYLEQVVTLVKERLKLLTEVVDLTEFFFREPRPSREELVGKRLSVDGAAEVIGLARERLSALEGWEEAALESEMRQLADERGLKAGVLFMALRVAITGRTVSPGLFETMRVVGRECTLDRLSRAVAALRDTEVGAPS
ncbi:MAG: glutamate--tRNA ligase, partial [Chloroflexota bacterium]|nr:glutamate--tRNA ligase [Chloroflexota bacterium]